MRHLLFSLVLLSGCASPFLEVGVDYQIDPWSDWVLQDERPWINDEPLYQVQLGLEWDGFVDCPYLMTSTGAYNQAFFGCSKRWGERAYANVQLKHQRDQESDPFLRTDQKQWQGHNPFLHVRVGYDWGGIKCPQIATGKSLFQGIPFERDEGNPDFYWMNVGCAVRFGGHSGVGR